MLAGRLGGALGALTLVSMACAQPPEASLALKNFVIEGRYDPEDPPDSIEGNVVSVPVVVEGIEIVRADGDTSGDSGHFDLFIDTEPVPAGTRAPAGAGIVHSAENPIPIYGLSVGRHTLIIVLVDGTHARLGDDVARATFHIDGPAVQGKAPATIEQGQPLTVRLAAEGVDIKPGDVRQSETSGHFCVLVDPEQPPEEGEAVPTRDATSVHTAADEVRIPNLERGEHVIWVALCDGRGHVFDPAVMDRLTVTVE